MAKLEKQSPLELPQPAQAAGGGGGGGGGTRGGLYWYQIYCEGFLPPPGGGEDLGAGGAGYFSSPEREMEKSRDIFPSVVQRQIYQLVKLSLGE